MNAPPTEEDLKTVQWFLDSGEIAGYNDLILPLRKLLDSYRNCHQALLRIRNVTEGHSICSHWVCSHSSALANKVLSGEPI